MKYPKINSLYKREGWYFDEDKKKDPKYQQGRQSLIEGDYASPEFGNIKHWTVQEKIDGTNIRIEYNTKWSSVPFRIEFKGRTDEATLPRELELYLKSHFTVDRMEKVFPLLEDRPSINLTLFGEGYGPKIQKCGGNYRKDQGFVLFDCYVNGWWLKQVDLFNLAKQLDVPFAPVIGIMSEQEIVEYVKSKPLSQCSETPQVMEGVICRPREPLLFRDGSPLMFKLKCKEFLSK